MLFMLHSYFGNALPERPKPTFAIDCAQLCRAIRHVCGLGFKLRSFAVKPLPMNLPRRDFLKGTLAASASAALASPLLAGSGSDSSGPEYYELRCYRLKADTRLKADANPALLDAYLKGALLPALGHISLKNIGVFAELDVNKDTATATPKPGSPVWVLIPHPSL